MKLSVRRSCSWTHPLSTSRENSAITLPRRSNSCSEAIDICELFQCNSSTPLWDKLRVCSWGNTVNRLGSTVCSSTRDKSNMCVLGSCVLEPVKTEVKEENCEMWHVDKVVTTHLLQQVVTEVQTVQVWKGEMTYSSYSTPGKAQVYQPVAVTKLMHVHPTTSHIQVTYSWILMNFKDTATEERQTMTRTL